MTLHDRTRRGFFQDVALVGGSMLLGTRLARAAHARTKGKLHLACNQYPWFTFYRREKRDFSASLDSGLREVAESGVDGFEPLVKSPDQIDTLIPLLKKYGLEMRSLYVNSLLYDSEKAAASIEQVLTIADKARQAGTRLIVTNPSPIRWGGPENKTDDQIKYQAQTLDKLGARLKQQGLTLAYHNHDIELRNAAREFHHMLLATDPKHVMFCLDAHWIYRGAGNSSVALFDVLTLYGERVTELHLRQSRDNIWTEALCDGDVDYPTLARRLLDIGVKPHLVLEQSVEKDSPHTMNAVEAHKASCAYASRVFAQFTD